MRFVGATSDSELKLVPSKVVVVILRLRLQLLIEDSDIFITLSDTEGKASLLANVVGRLVLDSSLIVGGLI